MPPTLARRRVPATSRPFEFAHAQAILHEGDTHAAATPRGMGKDATPATVTATLHEQPIAQILDAMFSP